MTHHTSRKSFCTLLLSTLLAASAAMSAQSSGVIPGPVEDDGLDEARNFLTKTHTSSWSSISTDKAFSGRKLTSFHTQYTLQITGCMVHYTIERKEQSVDEKSEASPGSFQQELTYNLQAKDIVSVFQPLSHLKNITLTTAPSGVRFKQTVYRSPEKDHVMGSNDILTSSSSTGRSISLMTRSASESKLILAGWKALALKCGAEDVRTTWVQQ